MSETSNMVGAAPGRRFDGIAALKDAGFTTLVAFGLLLPLVGFQTVTDVRNVLILQTRFPLLVALTACIGVGRLAYACSISPWLERRAARPVVVARPARFDWWAIAGAWFVPFAIGFVIV